MASILFMPQFVYLWMQATFTYMSLEHLIGPWGFDYISMINILGGGSLMFCKLSKIISRKYTMLEITFMVTIASWNLVHVPIKAWLWAPVQSCSLKFSKEVRFLQYKNLKRICWRARKTLVNPSLPLNVARASAGMVHLIGVKDRQHDCILVLKLISSTWIKPTTRYVSKCE